MGRARCKACGLPCQRVCERVCCEHGSCRPSNNFWILLYSTHHTLLALLHFARVRRFAPVQPLSHLAPAAAHSPGDDDDRPRPASQTVGAAICEHAAGRAAGQRAQTSCLLRGAHDHTITRGPWPAALARQPRPVDAARYLAPSAPPGSPLTSAPLTSSGAFHAAARSPRPDIKNAVAPERLPLHFMQGERVAGIRWDLRLLLRVTWANRRAIPCPAAGPLRRRRVGHRLASRSSKRFL